MPIWRITASKAEMGWRSDASQYNAIRDGLFTTGVAIGQRSKGWPDYEVKAIAAARIAGKSDAEIRELVKVLHAKRIELATVQRVGTMNHHTDPTNEKTPCAINTEGLETDTTNDLNFATDTRHSKAIAAQVAELSIRGHAVHQLKDGGFLVCKYGHTFHAIDFAELKAFARRLGVSQ